MKRLFTLVIAILIAYPLAAASPVPLRARHGAVASVSGIASQVGVDIMKKGGNAVDASVAVALTLAVVWPSAGNIGGGGFMLVRMADGSPEFIDYRERGPLAATRDMYLDEKGNYIRDSSTLGHRAVAVPGTIAGLALAQKRHGKLSWKEVVAPAERIAREGFTVDYHLAKSLSGEKTRNKLAAFPESRRIYLRDGRGLQEGDRFVQPELADTLRRLRDKGPREFYEGKTARLLVDEVKRGGGILTMEDLRTYEPTIRKPLRGEYRGYEILTAPPPSSGGALLIQMLHMLEGFDVGAMGMGSAAEIHLMTEVERRAFADRAKFMGDTDFVKVPLEGLMSREYAAARAKTIDLTRASTSAEVGAGDPSAPVVGARRARPVLVAESTETTHFSVVDGEGNVVSNTYTLNESYGSAVTVGGAGFLLNNEMDDFTSKPGVPNAYGAIQGENNSIAPKKRPLSSMTPTIVLKDGKVFFAIGSPGGTTIINTVLQVIVRVIDDGMTLQQAIDAPRFHHQWLPDVIEWEPGGLNADTRRILEAMGHVFEADPKMYVDEYHGDAEGVGIEPSTGMRLAASDPRRGGRPAGY